jgi:hypothetical protein
VPGKPRIGVWVTTTDVRLDTSYWGAPGPVPARLLVTVSNTGGIAERISMRYTLPDGLTDNGTAGCLRDGGNNYRCGAWSAAAGARWSAEIRVLVAPDAWRKMPLMGSVKVLAVAPKEPSLGGVQDNEGFAVLFPPGPPDPAVALATGELRFGVAADTAAGLRIKLRNTGSTAAQGRVEVILPDGVRVEPKRMPKRCAPRNPGGRAPYTECSLGRIPPRQTGEVSLPVVATIETQRLAPLSGAAIGFLSANGIVKRIQMSFRITAVAAESTPPPATPQATGSQGTLGAFAPLSGDRDGDLTGVQKTALALVGVSVLLVLLALALATTSLRRRMEDDPPAPPKEALPEPRY